MTDKFDASKYLMKLKGKDYLEVKWRLLWLRTEHPDAIVSTELMAREDGYALFKATVKIPGGGEATGWGSETKQDFGDFVEKAETKGLGRALAALGYGTQFCDDFDFNKGEQAEKMKVVDAPAEKPKAPTKATVSIDDAKKALLTKIRNKVDDYPELFESYDKVLARIATSCNREIADLTTGQLEAALKGMQTKIDAAAKAQEGGKSK